MTEVTLEVVTVACDPTWDPGVTRTVLAVSVSWWSGRNSHPSGENRQAGAGAVTKGTEPWCPRMSFVPRASSLFPSELLPELCCSPCLPWAILRQHLVAAVSPHQRCDSAPVQSTATLQRMVLENQNLPSYITAN